MDSYAWYSHDGVLLGWSPLAGKVALMSLRQEAKPREKQVEFAFYLGGRLLRAYTLADMAALGTKVMPFYRGQERGEWRALGCE